VSRAGVKAIMMNLLVFLAFVGAVYGQIIGTSDGTPIWSLTEQATRCTDARIPDSGSYYRAHISIQYSLNLDRRPASFEFCDGNSKQQSMVAFRLDAIIHAFIYNHNTTLHSTDSK
jgi:hypothetical protein